jgi:hypothetical protein
MAMCSDYRGLQGTTGEEYLAKTAGRKRALGRGCSSIY